MVLHVARFAVVLKLDRPNRAVVSSGGRGRGNFRDGGENILPCRNPLCRHFFQARIVKNSPVQFSASVNGPSVTRLKRAFRASVPRHIVGRPGNQTTRQTLLKSGRTKILLDPVAALQSMTNDQTVGLGGRSSRIPNSPSESMAGMEHSCGLSPTQLLSKEPVQCAEPYQPGGFSRRCE